MTLELSDEQAAALLRELDNIIDGDRYFLSPHIRALKKIRPEPERALLPTPAEAICPAEGEYGKEARVGRLRAGSVNRSAGG